MKTERRAFLKGAVAAAAAVAVAPRAQAKPARSRPPQPDDSGMLYDSTRCVGCMACMSACKRSNELPADGGAERALHDRPTDLSAKTKTVIKAGASEDGRVFYKAQCMHCIEPACVSVCMVQALHKSERGVVAYEPERCMGCRYCQVACAFDVPRFEWDTTTPKIVKCELCRHRWPEGKGPACCEVCPRDAVVFGGRDELLDEAHRRIEAEPGRYLDHVYGEREAGGTQVLVLSSVPFANLALPQLPYEPMGKLSETVQHGIYKGFIAPAVLYGVLAGVLWRNQRMQHAAQAEEV